MSQIKNYVIRDRNWCITHKINPNKDDLKKLCLVCKKFKNSWKHDFYECNHARKIWKAIKVKAGLNKEGYENLVLQVGWGDEANVFTHYVLA